MNDILDLPAERDLPPEAALAMRARILGSVRPPAARSPRLRIAVAATVLLAVASGAAAVVWDQPERSTGQVLAMGAGELSPTLRDAAKRCLGWNSPQRQTRQDPAERPVPVSLADLAVATERGDRALVLFMNDAGYATCDVEWAGTARESGGGATEPWPHGEWLPGPVQRLLLTSTESDGGDVSVSGRVSGRVHRLVLDHGDGHTTAARLSGGAFGLLTDDARLRAANDPELVSYDAEGTEIDRRPLFQAEDELEHCYAGPDGKRIYGKPTSGCRPAEKWRG
ncbi:hypothetical protein [Micromonospora mirobrigensis]|uniref:Uncharacterized protein n=1 Tax=Micromonospora mirobrigensis TaxID=262898 RepID=A0A1C4WIV1_9ACTN|nr:hypothetical protein [Micromonospora mirobrigensis]SCE96118.1 hypothetical protein GA0070564_102301 [Micromonospora mirobrigensis]